MPMQPSPSADTSRPCCPSFLLSMRVGLPRVAGGSNRPYDCRSPSEGALMRRLALVLIALVAAAALAVPPLAAGNRIDVPRKFAKALPKVKQKSGIAVRLPSHLNVGIKAKRVRGDVVTARTGRYELDLGVGKRCNGANACAIAYFLGEKGARFSNKRKVDLARGITGRFHRGTCGASCAPPSIQWKQKHVLYEIQLKATK